LDVRALDVECLDLIDASESRVKIGAVLSLNVNFPMKNRAGKTASDPTSGQESPAPRDLQQSSNPAINSQLPTFGALIWLQATKPNQKEKGQTRTSTHTWVFDEWPPPRLPLAGHAPMKKKIRIPTW
jgi:hypothetical protein